MAWEGTTKTEEEEKPKIFTTEDVAQLIEAAKQQPIFSPICCVLYGDDGVGKSGVALDSRTKEDIENGRKVVVIDLDNSSGPLKTRYFPNDENIVILDPVELDMKGGIDYVSSYNKVLAIVKYLIENEKELNLASVCLDGLDSLLKMCEYVMRYEDLKIDPDAQIKDSWQWARRNRRYLTVVLLLKRLQCNRFFTTHLKDRMQWQGKQLTVVARNPDWERSTPGIMFQKIALSRQEAEDGRIELNAKVEKAKGALHLEGKTYNVATVSGSGTKWNGLRDFYNDLKIET